MLLEEKYLTRIKDLKSKQKFVDLHRHSEFSLLDGLIRLDEMVENTPYIGALTDHGNMFGHFKYYNKMKAAGKVPIIGMEGYVTDIDGKKTRNHLILLAKNNEGYKNLLFLSSESYKKENFYYKPHININDLKEHSNGLIALTACLGGELPRAIMDKDLNRATEVIKTYKEIFGEDYYIEVQDHGLDEEKLVNPVLMNLANKFDIKVVATNDSHYLNEEDRKYHDILLCMQTKKLITDEDKFELKGYDYHLLTGYEFVEKWKDTPEVIENTFEVAAKCMDLDILTDKLYMPHFTLPDGYKTEEDYFIALIKEGFRKRNIKCEGEYRDRANYEFGVIKKMGFIGYFLVVSDYIRWAKENGVAVGPGRGSSMGSLICYLIGITEGDPLEHGLIFERFLNPDRVSMPDIDTDFSDKGRDKVIDYVRDKYGDDKVSNIIAFGTIKAKSAIKDVARVFGFKPGFGEMISKTIPDGPKVTLKNSFELSPEFKALYEKEKDVKKIVDIAMHFEGLPRQTSVHACGVLMSGEKITEHVPLCRVKETETSALEYPECESLGLLKMDFLGLRTMSVIEESIENINKLNNTNMSYLDIPIYDTNIYKLPAEGKNKGLFQIESKGMVSLMTDLMEPALYRENTEELGRALFDRLVAGISLYRPGPMDYIDEYKENMKHPEFIKYDTPELEPILKETFGQIVYQEQTMEIARRLAGYSMSQADILRKAMGELFAQPKKFGKHRAITVKAFK